MTITIKITNMAHKKVDTFIKNDFVNTLLYILKRTVIMIVVLCESAILSASSRFSLVSIVECTVKLYF